MNQQRPEVFSIALRLPRTTVDRIDHVASACRMTRTAWIRKAIGRNLAYAVQHELPLLETPELRAILTDTEATR